jgi:hypothetical protein
VFYSVAVEYDGSVDESIRDPRKALFTAATLIQANAEAFAAIPHDMLIEIDQRVGRSGNFISAVEDPYVKPDGAETTVIVREDPLRKDVGMEVVATLCGRYPAACRRRAPATLELFRCAKDWALGGSRSGCSPVHPSRRTNVSACYHAGGQRRSV